MTEFPPEVRRWLADSGWTPEHKTEVSDSVPNHHPARAVLSTLGGITLLERDCPDDEQPIQEFTFRPLMTTSPKIQQWSSLLKSKLVGVADEHNCHAELYMDEKGRCFSNSLIHDCFAFAGESLADALAGCLKHRRHRALLPPSRQSVSIYGENLQRGDPRIWDYEINR